ncbi:hypothetical protein N9515_00835 [Vicingaceae bacterium]|nr:hypothetical protein [Vicingaceae bacterium]MDB4060486.1 hypothetical protein [Vicingaceae bacterium]
MSRSNFFILHFRPIENYPPVQNLIYVLNHSKLIELSVFCLSTTGKLPKISDKGLKIFRFGKLSSNKIILWLTYLAYNSFAIYMLVKYRPMQVMYFESLSALPAYLYINIINPRAKLFIHYHEYTSLEEYRVASLVERILHRLEKRLYKKSNWISHTNEVRLNKFLKDENLDFNQDRDHHVPNFPLKSWAIQNEKWDGKETLKFVYVGYTLTEEGSYLQELIDYLNHQSEKIVLSIYCLHLNEFVMQKEVTKGNLKIRVYKGLAYKQLSSVLSKHHIGLVLYKAKTPNYIYNAPNKLFEYLSCGLDVWYPQEMQGIFEYDSNKTPMVKRLDFNNLSENKINTIFSSSEKSKVSGSFNYCAEEVYLNLINKILDK